MRHLLPAACLALAATGCDTDEILSVDAATVVPAATAINDLVSARAAAAGLYDALQDGGYYGVSFLTFSDLIADNALHSGTFSTYATADNLQINPENTSIGGIWAAIYRSIGRANAVIEALTAPAFVVPESDRAALSRFVGEAYLVRALGHHNATKFWGKVPVITKTITSATEASKVTRAEVSAVYAQILADLDSAQAYLPVTSTVGNTRSATFLAVRALRARVLFYRASMLSGAAQNAAYQAAIAEADYVMARRTLVSNFADLFDPRGNATTEDIWRIGFNDQDAGSLSYYYMSRSFGGRRELAPTNDMPSTAGDSTFAGTRRIFATADARRTVTWALDPRNRAYVRKYPSVTGTEHVHIIRLAEVILIKAESQARLGDLTGATTTLNLIRARAGLPAQVLGVSQRYTTQNEVIRFIIAERRRELAFEGDRYADLIRSGLVTDFLAYMNAGPEQGLYPVPQTERDVAPGIDQNPGY